MGTRVTCVKLLGFEELKKISCKVLLERFLALQVQAWFRVFLQPLDLVCCPSSYTNRLQFILRSSSNCCELLTIQHLQCFLPLRLRRLRPHPAVMEDQNITMRMKKQFVFNEVILQVLITWVFSKKQNDKVFMNPAVSGRLIFTVL